MTLEGRAVFGQKENVRPLLSALRPCVGISPSLSAFDGSLFNVVHLLVTKKSPNWPFSSSVIRRRPSRPGVVCTLFRLEQPVAVDSSSGKRLNFPHKKTIDKRDVMRELCSFFDFLCGEEKSGQLVRLSTTRVVIIDQQPPAD